MTQGYDSPGVTVLAMRSPTGAGKIKNGDIDKKSKDGDKYNARVKEEKV